MAQGAEIARADIDASTGSLVGTRPFARLLVAACAILLVAGIGALAAQFLFDPPQPTRPAPFGLGSREAAPDPTGLSGMILALQSAFHQALRGALAALRDGSGGASGLVLLGFAYGVFHAAGPGHGKAVIAAYLVADGRTLKRGFAVALAAALLQGVVAITLVGGAFLVFSATARSMDAATRIVELASFATVAAIGALLAWRKAGALLDRLAIARAPEAFVAARTGAADGSCCDHIPAPDRLRRIGGLREAAGVVAAAGLRPCAGAIVVLVFAFSQQLAGAGIAAVLAMAIGTALTTGAIASLAVFAKSLALGLAGGRGGRAGIALAGLELLAAAAIAVLGTALLAGLARGAGL